MNAPHLSDLVAVLTGSLLVTLLVLALGAIAAALDWLVGWMRRRQFSPSLCALIHKVLLAIAAIDLCLALAYSAAHAWEARPTTMRPPEMAVPAEAAPARRHL